MSVPEQQQITINPEIQHILNYFKQGTKFENHTMYTSVLINSVSFEINEYANNKNNEVEQWKASTEALQKKLDSVHTSEGKKN